MNINLKEVKKNLEKENRMMKIIIKVKKTVIHIVVKNMVNMMNKVNKENLV